MHDDTPVIPGRGRRRQVGLRLAAVALAAVALAATSVILAAADEPARIADDGAVTTAIASLHTWAFGDQRLEHVAHPSPIHPEAVRIQVVSWRAIPDPVARARAELGAAAVAVSAPALEGYVAIDAAAARARVLELRAIADPIERAQADLTGGPTP